MTFGLSYNDAMQALGKSIDFAAAKHMDLTSAATLVGKAMDGNTAILKRYGVDIATTKDQAAALTAAHDAAAKAIKAMGDGVDAWVRSVTAAIGADSTFESGLASAKDKAAYLVEQFKQGAIDLPQFTEAMTSLGVPLNETALKGGTAAEVLSKLNEQFGGAAQAAANTYTGIQERLKNATQELGEKIGMMLLPGLASITEAMIPVVDSFGRGIDAIQTWLTEVGKIPEVKTATDVVSQAFQALGQFMAENAKTAQEVLGPVLKELISALSELFTAFGPIIDAFKEMWTAVTGSQGDFDAFKAIIQAIAFEIHGAVLVIKAITEAVKIFADAFKAAADFISPVLAQISTAISTFLGEAKAALTAFYIWFVGGSMWQEMWSAVISVATAAISTLIGIFTSDLVKPITDILAALGATIQAGWNAAWSGLSEAFLRLTSSIQSTVASVWDPLSAYLQTAFETWGTWADAALASIQNAINTGMENLNKALTDFMGVVEKGWTDFGVVFNALITGIADTVIGVVTAASGKLNEILAGMIQAAQGAATTISGILAGIAKGIADTVAAMGKAAGTGGNAIIDGFNNAWNTVAGAATSFYDWLTGHSLWPDLMASLVSQTEAGMADVLRAFQGGFGGITLAAPTIPDLIARTQVTPAQRSAETGAASSSPAATMQSISVPVTVQVDGATVARTVEKRLISSRNLSAWGAR